MRLAMALSLTLSEIRRLVGWTWKRDIFPTPLLFNPKFENVSLALDH